MGFVQISVDALSHQALDGLIEEFVTRDGTDYGTEERSLDDKKDAVRRQLDCGEIVIVFDPETETSNIISKDDLRSGSSRLGARHLGVSWSADGLGLSTTARWSPDL
jgi:hypothetical protein